MPESEEGNQQNNRLVAFIKGILHYANRFAPSVLAVLFLVMYVIAGSEPAVSYTGFSFLLCSALYLGTHLLVNGNNFWCWRSRAEIWSTMKQSAIANMNWCEENKLRLWFYIGILLHGSALFATDGSRYIRVVTYVAPCLTALPTVLRFNQPIIDLEQMRILRNDIRRLEHMIEELSTAGDRAARDA
ncbi:unnamed protein product, partial [Musa acuminata subsp. burmannicoides]